MATSNLCIADEVLFARLTAAVKNFYDKKLPRNQKFGTDSLNAYDVVLLSLHVAHSYILLTANLEDVHAIAKQIAASPVANQLNQIIRRASSIFNQQYNRAKASPKVQQRADENLDQGGTGDNHFEIWKPNLKGDISPEAIRSKHEASSEASEMSGEGNETEDNKVIAERRVQGDDLVQLGKNASFYLSSIKKIFENV